MKNTIFKLFYTLIIVIAYLYVSTAQYAASIDHLTTNVVRHSAIEARDWRANPALLEVAKLKTPLIYTVPRDSQPANDTEDDGDPTGPTTEVGIINLTDQFEAVSPINFSEDFEKIIPFSPVIYRDHSSLNTYYFYPSKYFLKYDASSDGFDLNFLHRTRTESSGEDLVLMSFTLAPRELPGSVPLITELVKLAVKPANNKPVEMLRLPISSVEMNLLGLGTYIPPENIVVTNTPKDVGDDIKVQARLTQSQKEEIVASLRDGGLSGEVNFITNGGEVSLPIPFSIEFSDYSGDWVSNIRELSTENSIKNQSPYPLNMKGLVAYTKSGATLKRHRIAMASQTVMQPTAMAKADKAYSQLVSGKGSVLAVFPDFERVACQQCEDAVERKILVSASQASRSQLPIEAIPNVFAEGTFENSTIFKIAVDVKSNLFSSNNLQEETKTLTLRSESTSGSLDVFVNRDSDENEFEYRVRAFDDNGEKIGSWKESRGVMDITISKQDIEALLN